MPVAAPFSGELKYEDPSEGCIGVGGWVQRPEEGTAVVAVGTI